MAVPTSTTELVSRALSRRSDPGDDVVFHELSVEGAGQGVRIVHFNCALPRAPSA